MLDGVRSGWNRGDAEYSHEVDGEQTRRSSIFIHAARASQSANWSDRLRSSALRWIKESYVGVICSGSGSRASAYASAALTIRADSSRRSVRGCRGRPGSTTPWSGVIMDR
jgi:hypothetical protein